MLLVGASAAFGAKRSQLVVSNTLGLTFVVMKVLNDVALIGKGITPSTDRDGHAGSRSQASTRSRARRRDRFTGWLAGPSFSMAADDRERWLARIDSTRRYWLFLDLVWLAIVVSFYVG